jgi:hypothetical protein
MKATDTLSIREFADLFGFTPEALLAAIENLGMKHPKPFFTIPDLALRWRCSRGNVYNVLRKHDVKLLDVNKRLVPAEAVERIERMNTKLMG